MRARKCAVFMVAMVLVTGAANAQWLGLPVARDAEPGLAGDTALSGALTLGDDFNLFGGRLAYNAMDAAFIFGDIGVVDPDSGDTGWGIQVGGQYTLPLLANAAADIALRASIGYASHGKDRIVRSGWWGRYGDYAVIDEEIDVWTITGGGVIGHRFDEMFSIYGFLGLAYIHSDIDRDVKIKGDGGWMLGGATVTVGRYRETSSHSDIEPAFGAGASITITQKFSLFAELMHIEDPWFSMGACWDF